jgi:hypothetical protein
MDSTNTLSEDFSHLSVGDPRVSAQPLSPNIRTLARISLERDSFTDNDHKALDVQISKTFSIYQRLGEEPDFPSLLFTITAGDKRLVTLTSPEAKELLDREPSISGILRKAWQAGAFKEVRQLGSFPSIVCEVSSSTSFSTL